MVNFKELLNKFKKKPDTKAEFKNELVDAMREELEKERALDHYDVMDAQLKSESLERIERLNKVYETIDKDSVEKERTKRDRTNSLAGPIIGAISTLGATIALLVIEHKDMISGITAKEIVRVVLGGFRSKK